MLLNLYASEAVHCAISGGVDESTFVIGLGCLFQDLQIFHLKLKEQKFLLQDTIFNLLFYFLIFSLDAMEKFVLQKCWECVSDHCRWYRLSYQ